MNIAEKIIFQAIKNRPRTADDLSEVKRSILRSEPKTNNIPKVSELLIAYHKLIKNKTIKPDKNLEKLLVKRGVRTLSGVSIITVLTKPFPCPGQCVYCPDEKAMPKSYISDEPAAARALMLHFDPYEQVTRRIESLEANGHPTDKIELIVKGGTWNSYSLYYQYWFILRCFEGANAKNQPSKIKRKNRDSKLQLDELKKRLIVAQNKNEKNAHRVVGLTLETRPDFVDEKNIHTMRALGCTRVELGMQTIDDKILNLIKRGHDAGETKRATALLKTYGFKVDYHLMPQLPGSTPAKDVKMMTEIFTNPDYRPDMIKIYPCTVIKNSTLFHWWKTGRYKPYSDKKLVEVLKQIKTIVPRYVRISRLIRDIPGHHIAAGNRMTNLRQVVQKEMAAEGQACHCLRCREVGHRQNLPDKILLSRPKLFIDQYAASGGTEYFLSYENPGRDVVFAFCRLRLTPSTESSAYPAIIRELHTYGQTLGIGKREKTASQHKGLGKRLLMEAEKICRKNKKPMLAVISGIGVRGYYKTMGFRLQNNYMVKKLDIK